MKDPTWLWQDFHGGDPYLKQADTLMTEIEKNASKFVKGGPYFCTKVREIQAMLGTLKE